MQNGVWARRVGVVILVASALGAAGCSAWRSRSQHDVEAAIQEHLNGNKGLLANSFTTKIESVKIDGENADAMVKFTGQQNASLVVQIHYHLKRENGKWEVTSSDAMDSGSGNPHGATPPADSIPQPVPSH